MSRPHIEELRPSPDPVAAAERFLDLPHLLLLESQPDFGRVGRYSFLSADPFLVLRSKGPIVEEIDAFACTRRSDDPFEVLRRHLAELATECVPDLPPFQGGAAGYFGYDLCHHLESLPRPRHDDLDLPDMDLGLYDWVLAWDHVADCAWLISTGLPDSRGGRGGNRAATRASWVKERLFGAPASPRRATAAPARSTGEGAPEFPLGGIPGVVSNFRREAYVAAVRMGIEYILAGDIFQTNLSQRLAAPWRAPPLELYRRLRRVNPAPFAAYYDTGLTTVVSASPERFLKATDRCVETRPIKGTRPRGDTPEEDTALERSLQASEKDRAENVMIVDLLRNDLSRVCREHTVEVSELCVSERFATVHHLVSTVVGRLRPGATTIDLLRATFPGGSVTGAPKIRAMEIIAELEPTYRSVYCGSIGYLGFDQSMDTSIAIRTFILKQDGRAYFQVGGAVVADSDPEGEYQETLDKAHGLLAALTPV